MTTPINLADDLRIGAAGASKAFLNGVQVWPPPGGVTWNWSGDAHGASVSAQVSDLNPVAGDLLVSAVYSETGGLAYYDNNGEGWTVEHDGFNVTPDFLFGVLSKIAEGEDELFHAFDDADTHVLVATVLFSGSGHTCEGVFWADAPDAPTYDFEETGTGTRTLLFVASDAGCLPPAGAIHLNAGEEIGNLPGAELDIFLFDEQSPAVSLDSGGGSHILYVAAIGIA